MAKKQTVKFNYNDALRTLKSGGRAIHHLPGAHLSFEEEG